MEIGSKSIMPFLGLFEHMQSATYSAHAGKNA